MITWCQICNHSVFLLLKNCTYYSVIITHTYTHYFMRTIQCLKKYKSHEIYATELLGTIFCLSKCQVPLLSSRCIGPLSSTFGSIIFVGRGIMCRGLTVLWHVHYYLCHTVRSESPCALRLRYVDLVVSIEVAVAVCCCCCATFHCVQLLNSGWSAITVKCLIA